MGKRELLLVAVFVVIGVVVYQATAPAGDANRRRWSFGGIVEQIRREVRGNQARAESTRTEKIPAPATVKEIRIENFPSEVVIVGEEREDVALELTVESRGYDDAEAKKTAEETKVLIDQAGEMLRLRMSYPEAGRQTAKLRLTVPKRLALRVEEKGGRLEARNLAAVTIGGAGRGETVIDTIAGPVQVNQRGSAITIANIGSLKLTTINTGEVKVSNVRGNAVLSFQGGEVRIESLEGTLEVEARNAEMKFEKLEKVVGPVRFNVQGGELLLHDVPVEMRIDARRADVRVEQPETAAPLAIYAEGETTEVTLPSTGFVIDALAVEGRLTIDKGVEAAGLSVAGGDTGTSDGEGRAREAKVNGTVKNGGPTITLRATRGEISLRARK